MSHGSPSTGADISLGNLTGINFSNASISLPNLSGANVSGSTLSGVNLVVARRP